MRVEHLYGDIMRTKQNVIISNFNAKIDLNQNDGTDHYIGIYGLGTTNLRDDMFRNFVNEGNR